MDAGLPEIIHRAVPADQTGRTFCQVKHYDFLDGRNYNGGSIGGILTEQHRRGVHLPVMYEEIFAITIMWGG